MSQCTPVGGWAPNLYTLSWAGWATCPPFRAPAPPCRPQDGRLPRSAIRGPQNPDRPLASFLNETPSERHLLRCERRRSHEGQVLTLSVGEGFRGHRPGIDSSAPLATESHDEHTLPRRAERSRAR